MDKEQQKKHLIDMMEQDEKLGLYDEPKQKTFEENFIDCIGKSKVVYEPKQETLEEASWKFNPLKKLDGEFLRSAFIEGAKWQEQRMYAEEDIKFAYEQGARLALISQSELARVKGKFPNPDEWFEQFKKK